jgi:hypothetical protein
MRPSPQCFRASTYPSSARECPGAASIPQVPTKSPLAFNKAPPPEISPLVALAGEAQEVFGFLYGPVGLPENVTRDLGVRGVGVHGLGVTQAHLAQEQTLRLELWEVGEDPRRSGAASRSIL